MNYIFFAFLSAIFASLTSILAKAGMKKVSSNLATALRTTIVVIFSWLMAFISADVPSELSRIGYKTLLFLILSGLTTGASWLCYFHALKIGNINVVVPIDKSSIVLTIVLSSIIFESERLTLFKAVCTILIAAGTLLMIEKKRRQAKGKKHAVIYAFAGALFAALTSVLGKMGIEGISSDVGCAIRTVVVFIMAWAIVLVGRDYNKLNKIDTKCGMFILLSGIATGASWLCYYRALSLGPASIVAPIDKLSIAFTVLLSYIFFKEKLSKKGIWGLFIIVTGTLLLLLC